MMAWPAPSGYVAGVETAIVPDGQAFVYLSFEGIIDGR
jgi:hypothetical protein